MNPENGGLVFRQMKAGEPVPYNLLLLADPLKEMIETYLHQSKLFVAETGKKVVGVIVLYALTKELVEIKNIAVEPASQNQGIGKFLITQICNLAFGEGYKTICIGTANSSIAQLYLYQKSGFEISELKKDFFIQHYPEPIYENGIQAKHMVMLIKKL